MYCRNCGNLLNGGEKFCSKCGETINLEKSHFTAKREEVYANFGRRLGAYLLDEMIAIVTSILIFVIMTIIQVALSLSLGDVFYNNYNFYSLVIIRFFSILRFCLPILLILCGQPIISFIGDKSKKYHASFGKRKMQIKIVNINNNPVTTGQLFVRLLIKLFFPYGSIISVITILSTQKKQALQDLFLSQVVIKNKGGLYEESN